MGLNAETESTREMDTQEKIRHLLNGGVMSMVILEDGDEADEIREALADERYEDTTFRWIDGKRTLQRGSRSASTEARRRMREAMRNPQTDPTDQPDDWI